MKKIILFAASLFIYSLSNATTCKIQLSLLKSQINITAANIANINTTRTPIGGPYRKQTMICNEVNCNIIKSNDVKIKYEPQHPDTQPAGFVFYPDINLEDEISKMSRLSDEYALVESSCSL